MNAKGYIIELYSIEISLQFISDCESGNMYMAIKNKHVQITEIQRKYLQYYQKFVRSYCLWTNEKYDKLFLGGGIGDKVDYGIKTKSRY